MWKYSITDFICYRFILRLTRNGSAMDKIKLPVQLPQWQNKHAQTVLKVHIPFIKKTIYNFMK
jgi:hypothetical protein